MRPSARLFVAISTVAFSGVAALAKAPRPAEVPTVEEIVQQAKQALETGGKGGRAVHDPVQDVIDLYKDKTKTPLSDFQALVECINDPKETTTHRMAAAEALFLRFSAEDKDNADVRSLRRNVGNGILELMKVDEKKDPTGLEAVDYLLNKWWRPFLQVNVKWVKSGSQSDRRKAYDKMKKILKDKEN